MPSRQPSRSTARLEPTPKILSILAQEREKVTGTQLSSLIGDTHKTEFNLPVADADKIGFVFQFCLSAENPHGKLHGNRSATQIYIDMEPFD